MTRGGENEAELALTVQRDSSARSLPIARDAWIALSALTLVQFFSYLDRMLLAALGAPIQAEFSLSDTELGVLTGFAFALLYAIVGLPLGRVADHGWRRMVLVISFCVWSAMTAISGLVQSYWQLCLARVGVGIAEAGCIPSCFSMISAHFAPQRRPLAFAIFGAASMLGTFTSFSLGGFLGETYGWRTAFLVIGLPGVLLAAVVAVVLREPRHDAGKVPHTAPASAWEALSSILGNTGYVWLIAGIAGNTFTVYGVAQWMQLFFMRSHDLSLSEAGTLFGATFGSAQLLGFLLGGMVGNRMARRSVAHSITLPITASLVALPAFLTALWAPNLAGALVAAFAALALGSMAIPASLAGAQSIVDPHVRATAAAVYMVSTSLIGIGLSALIVGALSDGLRPSFGAESLRYALTIALSFNLIAAYAYSRSRAALARRNGVVLSHPLEAGECRAK